MFQVAGWTDAGFAPTLAPIEEEYFSTISQPAAATAYEAENKRKYITLDDGSSWDYIRNQVAQDSALPYLSQDEPMRTGSQVSFAKPVILDYRFQWNYQPTGQVVGATDADDPVSTENDRETTAPAVGRPIHPAIAWLR